MGTYYLGKSKVGRKLFKKGWSELVENGHAEPYKDLDEMLTDAHIILSKHGRKHVGILAYYLYDNCELREANVLLAYVLPEYREQGRFNDMVRLLNDHCHNRHGVPFVYWNVHKNNLTMQTILKAYYDAEETYITLGTCTYDV